MKRLVWVGFIDDRPDVFQESSGGPFLYAIYLSERAARRDYEDVRGMLLTNEPRKILTNKSG